MTDYNGWIGRSETARDVAASGPIERLAALLDHATPVWPPGELPPLGHWLHCLPSALQSKIGDDGHPQRGGLIPPTDLPRRMWAGSRMRFPAPVRFGAALERTTTVAAVTPKTGKSGAMLFVTLRHDWTADGTLATTEEQDLVYRAMATGPTPVVAGTPDPRVADASRIVRPGPVELFRYSALTYNGHRIHYDRSYVTGVEHYPGLVVHGPYLATLLLDHWRRHNPAATVAAYDFRAMSPLFDGEEVALNAAGDSLWASRPGGGVCIEARVKRG